MRQDCKGTSASAASRFALSSDSIIAVILKELRYPLTYWIAEGELVLNELIKDRIIRKDYELS